jgi:hypothetical protein
MKIKEPKKSITKMTEEEFKQWKVYNDAWNKAISTGSKVSYEVKYKLMDVLETLKTSEVIFHDDHKTAKSLVKEIQEQLKTIDTVGKI